MKYIFTIIIFVHGLIHLLGFIKSFGFKDIKDLTLSISKPFGIIWLLSAVLFLTYGILFIMNIKYSWLIGILAVAISQFLIIIFWKDAKYGIIPNALILVIAIISFADYNFHTRVQKEISYLLSQNHKIENRIITENDIQHLPLPVRNWLIHVGVVGKPYIYLGKVTQKARLKMKPEQENWMNAIAEQYTTIENPSFIWTVEVKMNSFLYFQGRDKFENGKGEMLIKINSLVNVVNETGEKLDEGSLQRYLGEMVWFPSLALSPYIAWEQLDSLTAKATMTYKGTTGSGIFYFNPNGDFIKFFAMRYMGNAPDANKYEWILLVNEHKSFEGINVPSKMTATWKLKNKDWTWLELEITDINYNENVYH